MNVLYTLSVDCVSTSNIVVTIKKLKTNNDHRSSSSVFNYDSEHAFLHAENSQKNVS